MDFFQACLKKVRACPFSKATGPGLVHEKCFLGDLCSNDNVHTVLQSTKNRER